MPDFQHAPQSEPGDSLAGESFTGAPGRTCGNTTKGLQPFEGTVVRKVVNAGSKSEHDAVVLRTDAGDYKLRLPGGNPFSDPGLDVLVGKKISFDGVLLNNGTLIIMPDTLKEIA